MDGIGRPACYVAQTIELARSLVYFVASASSQLRRNCEHLKGLTSVSVHASEPVMRDRRLPRTGLS